MTKHLSLAYIIVLSVFTVLVASSISFGQSKEIVETVVDDFSNIKAWSTMREAPRMKEEYAEWEMSIDPAGYKGSCLRLNYTPIATSADIWGSFRIEEPIESVGLWIKNSSSIPVKFSLTINENDGSMFTGGDRHLPADSQWHHYIFPFGTFELAPWSSDENDRFDYPITKIIPVLSGTQPSIPLIISFDELTIRRFAPTLVNIKTNPIPARINPGENISITGTIIPDEAMKSPEFEVQLVHNGAVMSRVPVTTEDWVRGKPTSFGPATLKVPERAWSGFSNIVFKMSGVELKRNEAGILKTVQISKVNVPMTSYTVRSLNGTPHIFENETPIHSTGFMYEYSNPDQVRKFADAGVHLYYLECRHMGWIGQDEYDFSLIDQMMAELFDCDPDARVIPFFYIDMAPPLIGPEGDWWQELHPDQLCIDENGNVFNRYGHKTVSFASTIWREDSSRAMHKFIDHLENSPYADRIVGYQPCAGTSYEWMYHGGHDFAFLDYSKPTLSAFQNWLKEKYDNDVSRLRKAWKDNSINFENTAIPLKTAREKAAFGSYRDPEQEMQVIDYYIFLSELTVDTIEYFCSEVKKATKNQKLTGIFYGYVLEQMMDGHSTQHTGHFGLGKILESKSVDFMMSPTSYNERGAGGTGGFMTAVSSIKLHNKLWINQADLRTYLSPKDANFGRTETAEQTVGVMRREFSMDLAAGIPLYWYSFSNRWYGSSDVLMKEIETMAKIGISAQELDRGLTGNKLAVLVSDSPAAYLGMPTEPIRSLVYLQRESLNRSGIQYDIYLDSDLLNPNMPRYKAYLFLSSIYMDDKLRVKIEDLKKDGRVLAWIGPQGIANQDLSLKNASDLCGINLEWEQILATPTIKPIKGLGPEYGSQGEYSPQLIPNDSSTKTLGVFTSPDELKNRPGLVIKNFAGWTALYSAAPRLSPEIIREIAMLAGIHIYSTANDAIYISDNHIAVHAKEPGIRYIKLPSDAKIVDCFTDKIIAEKTNEFSFEIGEFQTNLFQVVK